MSARSVSREGADSPTGDGVAAEQADDSRAAFSVDNGDGTYKLRFQSEAPGTFDMYVKLDGLHVLGSPARGNVF